MYCPPTQTSDAVAEAHRVGVVHRALTPENILVAEGNVVKVVDFIRAKMGGQGVKTTQGRAVGAVYYMAPEQACGAPAHPCMDVYGIGGVGYEAITGVRPMGPGDRSLGEAIDWQLRGHPVPLRALVPGAPPALAALVHRALSKVPSERPTMREFTEGLRDVVTALRAAAHRELSQLTPDTHTPGAALTRVAFFDLSAILASTPGAPGAPVPFAALPPRTPEPPAPATVTPLPLMEPPATIRSATEAASAAPPRRSGTGG